MKVSVFDDNGEEVWNHARDNNGNRSGMAVGDLNQHGTSQDKIIDILDLALHQAKGEESGPMDLN